VTGVTHPAWCSPRYCRDGGNQFSKYGEHRSEPVGLDLRSVLASHRTAAPSGTGAAYLTRSICPWTTEAYLHLEADGESVSLPLSSAAGILAQLTDLAATAAE
jgi:hypothetical protein